jgi:hypothetical protein
MSERNGSTTISEVGFKRLCGEVWADSLSNLDSLDAQIPGADEETLLLKQVLKLLRAHLGLGEEDSGTARTAVAYRREIDALMQRFANPGFDHNRILARLLREVLRQQVA